MIFDCFPFFNEYEILELRLMELNDVVDYFVIAEANTSHNGTPKGFNFEANSHRYRDYFDKIIYVKVEDMPEYDPKDIFKLEYFQRNALKRGYEGVAKEGDRIIVSDCDEILNPQAIREYKDREEFIAFSQHLFYYYVNNLFYRAWCRAVMAPYGSFKEPNDLRNWSAKHIFKRAGKNIASNGGWHYSYMTGGDAKRVKDKVALFAEKHLNVAAGTVEEIAEKMAKGKDLYGRERYNREGAFKIVDISNDKPKSLDKFLEKYPDFIFKEDK